ncbi:MAG: helix-turn-helix domain-containing protein [Betaproteobacteria bacterium]|nr:helix-turn-helix domain-containing protein [Betaproteobacteria bacterium]
MSASQTQAAAPAMTDAARDDAAPAPAQAVPTVVPPSPTPGPRLRQAREAQGLSVADLAARLRMGVKQIQALENDDYGALPTGTFLRGFVRNYAKAVGLDATDLLASLERSHAPARAVLATPVVEPARQKMPVREPAKLLATPQAQGIVIAVVILLLAAAFAYWWTQVRGGVPRTTTTSVSMPAGAGVVAPQPEAGNEKAPTKDEPAPAAVAGAKAPDSPAAQPQAGEVAIPAPPPSPPATPAAKPVEQERKPRAAGSSVLGFTFTGESWVEVTDANGRVVLSKKFRAGDAEEVSGRGPLAVVVGNAANTRMALNGLEFDLVPHTRGAVARVNAK